MNQRDQDAIRASVRQNYARIAQREGSGGASSAACCGTGADAPVSACGCGPQAAAPGPAGAELGLSSGDPLALAALRPGETVVDLGSGAGRDVFPAARQVGPTGHVIGVDMTPEMTHRARQLAQEGGYGNVSFRLGEIEHLPVADASADVVVSNCVINLAPDQARVYREAFRVLRPGGRLVVSDVVAPQPLPERLRADPARWSACVAGAETPQVLERLLGAAGFEDVRIELHGATAGAAAGACGPGTGQVQPLVVPATIRALKPRG